MGSRDIFAVAEVLASARVIDVELHGRGGAANVRVVSEPGVGGRLLNHVLLMSSCMGWGGLGGTLSS